MLFRYGDMFDKLRSRGVQKVGMMVVDGIAGLDTVIGQKFQGTAFQRCTTHIKRNMLAHVRHGDKKELADDMREVFKTKGSPRVRLLPPTHGGVAC